ncbi:MAG: 50S ribosomal protein L17 [Candidatus Bipolaricaulia bacterium]
MDHKTKGWNLAKSSHQKQIVANLVKGLIKHGKVDTTVAKAKEASRFADRMVTLAKKGDEPARRRAFSFLNDKEAVTTLFENLGERYEDRQGGYTRVLRLPPRKGDGAEMARLTFVESE